MIKITLHTKSVTISGKIVHLINVDLACFVSNNLKGKTDYRHQLLLIFTFERIKFKLTVVLYTLIVSYMLFLFLCILLIVVIHTVVFSVCPVGVSVDMIFVYVRMVYFLCAYCNCISTCVMNLSAAGICIFPNTSASSIINNNDVCEILLTVMY